MSLCLRRPCAPRTGRRLAFLTVLVGSLAVPVVASGERLPVQRYTAAEGLAHERIGRIVRDSRGFLWFCTAGGLSRFDGRRFVTYSAGDELPVQSLNDLLENLDGSYWIATNDAGLVRYDPAAHRGGKRFAQFAIGPGGEASRANVLHRDRAGRLWVGTDGGLFLVEREQGQPVFRPIALHNPSHADHVLQVWSMLEDPDGNLWIGTSAGLIRRTGDGRSIHYRVRPSRSTDHVLALAMDPQKRLWIGHNTGLLVLNALPSIDARPSHGTWAGMLDAGGRWYAASDGLVGRRVFALLSSTDGRVWIGTDVGLNEFAAGRLRGYGNAHGIEGVVTALAEDAYGSVWAGTQASGAIRVARGGLATYTSADGLEQDPVGGIFETVSGELCTVGRGPWINVFDGQRFHAVVPDVLRSGGDPDNRNESYATALQDRGGGWWIPSGDRLYRFRPVADVSALKTATPLAVYRLPGGPASRGVWRLFEDSRGDLWIAMRVAAHGALTRWERATGVLHHYSDRDGLPVATVQAFAEDRAGNLWIGFRDAGLARYREGRFRKISAADGLPTGGIAALYVDRGGRLWCGTALGLFRIDEPAADRPGLVHYSVKDGLSDAAIMTIVEDRGGRLYVGTRRGVDRLDLTSGRIRRYTTADGLAALETDVAYLDRHGTLWYGTSRGVSRLQASPEPPQPSVTALLGGLRIDGNPQPLSDLGQAVVGPLKVPSARSRIEIEFFALSFAPGEVPKYQYTLDGIDSWSPPTDQQTVTYPRLAPGTYRFLVRAVGGSRAPGATPASLTFTIPPPVWARWWFLLAAAALVLSTFHAAYRYRLARLLEIERIRTRLAMDLHDDIGSTLSQVAVLSAVARQRLTADGRLAELLERIADISRQLVDAMSDVVWAINPERDSLRDLAQRMRRFAAETLDSQNVQLGFDGSAANLDARLGAEVRREVFLIFKESIHNLVRYAKCTRVHVGLTIEGPSLVPTVEDDGVGLDTSARVDGLGLRSMRERAGRLGGELRLRSAPGEGTTMHLVVPLGRRR